MVSHQSIVVTRTHYPVSRHGISGKSQLHTEHVRHEASDHGHEKPRPEVLQTDHLVIGGKDVLTPKSWFMSKRVSCLHRLLHNFFTHCYLPVYESCGSTSWRKLSACWRRKPTLAVPE